MLTHGHSRVVLALLRRAVAQGINFSVVVTEGRPDGTGQSMARALDELGVPVTLVLDSGVAYALERYARGGAAASGVGHGGAGRRSRRGAARRGAGHARARAPGGRAGRPRARDRARLPSPAASAPGSSPPLQPTTMRPSIHPPPPPAPSVDMVLTGAEGVVENGGVINKLGTYQIALCAKALGRPFYVAAESYKFARLYPLNQQARVCAHVRGLSAGCRPPAAQAAAAAAAAARAHPPTPAPRQDLPVEHKPVDVGPLLPRSVAVDNPSRDYTPPQFISLLVTDLGVLTPAAVSDELIQLYV